MHGQPFEAGNHKGCPTEDCDTGRMETKAEIYWTLFEEAPGGLQPELWLSPRERDQYRQFKFPKRQSEWLLGRAAAKHLLLHSRPEFSSLSPQTVSISNEPEGAPYFLLDGGERLAGCISISHNRKSALCGLSFDEELQVGVDLEWIEPRFPGMAEDFFSAGEMKRLRDCPAGEQDLPVTILWSAKEALLKALRKGLRLDTRQVEVTNAWPGVSMKSPVDDWVPLQVLYARDEALHWIAAWQRRGNFVLTAAVCSRRPVELQFLRV